MMVLSAWINAPEWPGLRRLVSAACRPVLVLAKTGIPAKVAMMGPGGRSGCGGQPWGLHFACRARMSMEVCRFHRASRSFLGRDLAMSA